MNEVKLPSGAVLKISRIPFADAMALNEAIVEELKGIQFTSESELGMVYKDLFCTGFASKKIKASLWKCFERCQYDAGNGALKIDKDTFEPEEARQDYASVCMEVAKSVLLPFVKAHSAEFFQVLGALQTSPESKPKTTPS